MHVSLPGANRVKLLSKTLPSHRASRIRVAWFVLGMAFGIGCSTAFSPPDFQATLSEASPAPTEESAPAHRADRAPLPEAETPQAAIPTPLPVVAVVPPAPPVQYPLSKDLKVEQGDTFVTVLGKAGIGTQESHTILSAMGKKFNPRSLSVGDELSVTLDKDNASDQAFVQSLSLAVSARMTLHVQRTQKGDYAVKQVDVPVVKKLARSGGKITSSLYETVVESGMPSSMVGEIIKAYSYDVDFQREIQHGDSIDVVFEQMQTEDGKRVGFGNIIYASLDLGNRKLDIFRHTDKSGNSDFFNAKGESVRKALLRTPISGARISSGFGMRSHPILGYSKMHKGVDFAAPIGTPIYAAGDGVVSFVGRKGGYGNYLQIKHNAQYASAYAHLSRFATGVAPGKKVKQGQIVAYVGNTGASTGPHLHYEIHANGAQVNPAGIKFKTGTLLAGNELKTFKKNLGALQAQLSTMGKPSGKMAMLELGR